MPIDAAYSSPITRLFSARAIQQPARKRLTKCLVLSCSGFILLSAVCRARLSIILTQAARGCQERLFFTSFRNFAAPHHIRHSVKRGYRLATVIKQLLHFFNIPAFLVFLNRVYLS